MSSSSYLRSDTAMTLVPWIVATASCVLSFVLLAQFIDTLHVQMQRGQALRAGQATTADAELGAQRRMADARWPDLPVRNAAKL